MWAPQLFVECVIAGLIALLCAGSASATDEVDPLQGFDAYIKAALADWQTPGLAVAIVQDGKLVLAKGYGVCGAGEEIPVDEHTIFPIASVTKAFTATCLALLVEEGKLQWNDPVVRHLPEFQLYDPFVTRDARIEDLLSHRVVLETADLVGYRGDYDRMEILRRLRFVQPVGPFRSRFVYNNHVLVAAGEVLERVSGQPWETVVRGRLLDPLGMHSTLVDPQELEGRTNIALPHLLEGGTLVVNPAWKTGPEYEGFRRLQKAVAPAGAIHSNVIDMAQFVQMYLDEGAVNCQPLLAPDTVRTMLAPHSAVPIQATPQQVFAYPRFFVGGGLGWQLRDYRGRKVVMHGGSTGAVAAMLPEERIGIVVLANRGCGIVYMVMHDTFDRLLGIPRTWTNRDWLIEAEENPAKQAAAKIERLEATRQKDSKPSLPLSGYTGVYECDLYGALEVLEADSSLRLQFGPNIAGSLVHWEQDSFRAKLTFPPGEEWLIRFHVSADSAESLHVTRLFWHEPMPEFHRTR
jgi:CubicO group peptidase (beta-lactamase class C family)